MEDRPPDGIESIGHQEYQLGEDDIAENDPIHDYETTDTEESEDIQEAQKTASNPLEMDVYEGRPFWLASCDMAS